MTGPVKTVFFASDTIALPALEALRNDLRETAELSGVITQPDRPAGRGRKLKPNPVKQWAAARGLPVRQPVRLGPEDSGWLRSRGCELILVMAYGQFLKKKLLEVPRLPPLNLHPSLLPALRGASPIEAAIASGLDETGVTLMRVAAKMDAGPVADAEKIRLARADTAASLREKAAQTCVPLLRRALPAVISGRAVFTPQDESRATYTRLLKKEDGVMDFEAPARELASRVRALQPWPGCFFDFAGARVKTGMADWRDEKPAGAAGEVLGQREEGLAVAAGEGVLLLPTLQRPGGRMLPAAEFLRGFPIPAGTVLAGRPMPPLVSSRPFPKKAAE